MNKRFLSLLLMLMTVVTGAWADPIGKYLAADGLNFQRSDDNKLTLLKAGIKTEYVSGTSIKVGYAKYDQESYVIPAEVDGMPVVAMETGVFQNNKTIKQITFPNGQLTIVSSSAFSGCTALEKLDFSGSSIKRIETNAFYGCTALESIDNWGVVDSLGQYAFRNCTALTAVNIGASITKIASAPFNGCTNLKTVRFEDTATRILINNSTASMFYNCPVETVYLGRKLVLNNGGVTFNNACLFKSHTTITEFELGEQIDTIPNSLFGYMTSTMTVRAPNVVHIDKSAFSNSKNITLIAPKLKSIGHNAFEKATLPSFDFSTVEIIGKEAFLKCAIDEIVLPNNVKEVYKTAFNGIIAKNFRIEDGDEAIELGVDETITDLSDISRYNNKGWLTSTTLEELYIGRPIGHAEKLTGENNALIFNTGSINSSSLSALKTLTLTKVTVLYSASFASCTKLQSVSMPLLTAIPASCFYKCSSLTWEGINLPSMTSIDASAFCGCTSLQEFTVPSRVTALGSTASLMDDGNVLGGCTGMKRFTIEDNSTTLFSSGVGTMANLEEIYIGRELAGSSEGMVFGQATLKHVTFGNQIESLTCYKDMGKIHGYSIQGANVETVRCLTATPIALSDFIDYDDRRSSLFPAVNGTYVVQENATLIVPKGSLEAYKAAPVWKGFSTIVEDEGLVGDANGDNKVDVADIVEIVNYLNENSSARFNEKNADADGIDGVTIEDINAIVNIILDK